MCVLPVQLGPIERDTIGVMCPGQVLVQLGDERASDLLPG